MVTLAVTRQIRTNQAVRPARVGRSPTSKRRQHPSPTDRATSPTRKGNPCQSPSALNVTESSTLPTKPTPTNTTTATTVRNHDPNRLLPRQIPNRLPRMQRNGRPRRCMGRRTQHPPCVHLRLLRWPRMALVLPRIGATCSPTINSKQHKMR
jgi:hypothetical protein